MGVADGLAVLVGVGVAVCLGVGFGVAVALGLGVAVGVVTTDGEARGVGLTNIIRIAPPSGTGEITGVFRTIRMTVMTLTIKRTRTMSVIAAIVFRRSSIFIG